MELGALTSVMVKVKLKDLNPHLCRSCMVDGVIICTATESRVLRARSCCNKGALSMEEAKERKRLGNEKWAGYVKSSGGVKFRK